MHSSAYSPHILISSLRYAVAYAAITSMLSAYARTPTKTLPIWQPTLAATYDQYKHRTEQEQDSAHHGPASYYV